MVRTYHTSPTGRLSDGSICYCCMNTYVLEGRVYCNHDMGTSKNQLITKMCVFFCDGYKPRLSNIRSFTDVRTY